MAGVVQPDSGVMELEGQPVTFRNPAAATARGIACIFQELSLIPDLTVADNIAITNPPARLGLIDHRAQRRLANEALARAGAEGVHPLSKVRDLPLSRRQMVEIAKALARNPKILILDEATSALTAADVSRIFTVLKQLRSEGLAIVYISHRMHEIAEIADDCAVFRNGRDVGTFKAGTKSDDAIVEMMIGREYKSVFPPKPTQLSATAPVLKVRNLSWANRLKGIDLTVGSGEVVGLGGLDGQGQHELLLALFGVLRGVSGAVEIGGKPVTIKSPRVAKRRDLGMALIPSDRKTEGLMLPMSVRDNLSFAAIERFSHFGLINSAAEKAAIKETMQPLQIRSDGIAGPVGLSPVATSKRVVLLGHIDLSIPWVVTIGGMMSTAAAGWGGVNATLAIPIGIACGLAIGLINGIGVAYLRVPSMIFTLATNVIVQGLMIIHTSGFAPQDRSTGAMHIIAVERSIFWYSEHVVGMGDSWSFYRYPTEPNRLGTTDLCGRQL
jgi:ribose transport system ATP-binding protein